MVRQDRDNADLVAAGPPFAAELDRRIAAMRRLLTVMAPGSSTSAALRTLRDAFPDEPLGIRLRALKDRWN